MELRKPSLQKLEDDLFREKDLEVYVLRLDLIHPFISGNKWYKLKYNIEEFKNSSKEYLITFGGAYSNHIVATAAAGKEFGIKTIGIIRGEELNAGSNEVLRFASGCGMQLFFVSREDFRSLKASDKLVRSKINSDIFIVPEGGSNEFALKGCEEIVKEILIPFDYIFAACGTGMTLAGITRSLNTNQKAIGISVLHGEDFLSKDISSWSEGGNYDVLFDYHFGGYAKTTNELKEFCRNFYFTHYLTIEPIYTGKLFFGLYDLIMKDYFNAGKTIIAIHTCGIFDFSIKPS